MERYSENDMIEHQNRNIRDHLLSEMERKRMYLPIVNKNRRIIYNFENYVMNYEVYEQNLGPRKIYWKITKPIDERFQYMGTFSASLFRRETATEEGFRFYTNGLKGLMDSMLIFMNLKLQKSVPFLTKNINNRGNKKYWKLRLYIDQSCENTIYELIQDILLKYPKYRYYLLNHIEIYQYFIPEMCYQKIEEGKTKPTFFHYPESTIGTIMRFMPLIYSTENELIPFQGYTGSQKTHFCKRVIVVDIDSIFAFRLSRILEMYVKSRVNFGFNTRDGHQYYLHRRCSKYGHIPFDFYSVIAFFVYQWSGNNPTNYKAYPMNQFILFYNKSMNDFFTEHHKNMNGKITRTRLSNLKECQIDYVFGYGYDELFANQYLLKYHYEQQSNIRAWARNGYYGVLFKLLEEVIQKGLQEDEDIRFNISKMLLSFTGIWINEEDQPIHEWRKITPEKLAEIGIIEHPTRMNISRRNETVFRRNIERGRYINIEEIYHIIKTIQDKDPTTTRSIIYSMFKDGWKHEMMKNTIPEEMNINKKKELFFPHQQINYYFHRIELYLDAIGNPLSLQLKNSIHLNKLLSINFEDIEYNYRFRDPTKHYKIEGYFFYFITRLPRQPINIIKYLSTKEKLDPKIIPAELFTINNLPNGEYQMIYHGEW